MTVAKVILNDVSQIDLTSDTVTAESLLSGFTAHDASGTQITGTASGDGGSGSANFASGTYTPSENQKIFNIDTGIDFTRFVMFATTNVYQAGSGVRTIGAILYDSNMEYTWKIGSNAAGTAGSATIATSGFSVSGTEFQVNQDQYIIGGYTYNWIAW
jgi:hypothetical protein